MNQSMRSIIFFQFIPQLLRLFLISPIIILLPPQPPTRLQILLIRILRIPHTPDRIIMRGQTIGNTPMKGIRRLRRSIHIHQIMTLHIQPLPINRRINNPIPHRLGHHKLRALRTRQPQPLRNIPQRNPRITRTQPPQPRLHHRMRQTGNKRKRPIRHETLLERRRRVPKDREIPPSYRLGDFEIGCEFSFHSVGEEYVAVGDFSHE
mmetsp:Transcript_32469/g.38813  ORF Transcript_32469/g.38813 Transcript_32469/m.38813 type:complete len:207 (-) Transcript_32469:229-849(-)